MYRPHLIPPLVAALVACVVAPLATAQTPTKPTATKAKPKTKSSEPLLTRTELRACMAQQERIDATNAAAMREREGLDKEKAEILQFSSDLKEQLVTLDRTSQEAVDKYNADALERDRRIDVFEARMTPFNQKVEALAADREDWKKNCANRPYDEIDEIQIRRGK